MAETYTLDRDEQRPLRFTGTLLDEERGYWWNGKDRTRWYDLTLYAVERPTPDAAYIAHIAYHTRWQGEGDHALLYRCPTLEDAVTHLERFDPTEWVVAYKPLLMRNAAHDSAGDYRARQDEVERAIRDQYASQVAALCRRLDLVEDL